VRERERSTILFAPKYGPSEHKCSDVFYVFMERSLKFKMAGGFIATL
jgi:hypothetical protein